MGKVEWLGCTHSVDEARLVSSAFSLPSTATPRRCWLSLRVGIRLKVRVRPALGTTGHPSLGGEREREDENVVKGEYGAQ